MPAAPSSIIEPVWHEFAAPLPSREVPAPVCHIAAVAARSALLWPH